VGYFHESTKRIRQSVAFASLLPESGVTNCLITAILSGSARLVPEPTSCPQNFISGSVYSHFFSFNVMPEVRMVCKNSSICSRCLCHSPECTAASSMYASANALIGLNTYCRFLQNVQPLDLSPNAVRFHSNRSFSKTNPVFQRSSSRISVCQYPAEQSNVLRNLDFPILWITS